MAIRRRTGATRKTRRQQLSVPDLMEVLVVISVLGLLVASVYKLRLPETLPVLNVHFVTRLQHMEPEELRQGVLANLHGSFLNVDLRAIEQSLESLSWVDTASVRRQWPDTLLVKLKEQEVIARWGNEGMLNPHGEVFYPREKQQRKDLPILFGPEGMGKEMITTFRHFYKLLSPAGLKLYALVLDERRAWHILLANGIRVALGRGETESRLQRFVRVYPKVLAPRATKIVNIDLRYTNGFAVAWQWNKEKQNQLTWGSEFK